MKKFLIALAVVALGVMILVVKIQQEEAKTDRETNQIGNQNMCQIVGCGR